MSALRWSMIGLLAASACTLANDPGVPMDGRRYMPVTVRDLADESRHDRDLLEVTALVGFADRGEPLAAFDGWSRRFRIVDGMRPVSELARQVHGFEKARVWGRYHVAVRQPTQFAGQYTTEGASFELDGWRILDVPLRRATLEQVERNPDDFHWAHIEIDGVRLTDDEYSVLDDGTHRYHHLMWLDGDCGKGPVRAVGWLFTNDEGYGHLGRYETLLVASACTPR